MIGSAWSDGEISRLEKMWLAKTADGKDEFSTAAMGRALGRSSSSIVGKAHRIGLPGRPNPSKPRGDKPPKPAPQPRKRVARAPKVTLELVQSPPEPSPPPPRRSSACCWPLGQPGTEAFRFCEGASEPGKPYCPDHAKLAYDRRPVRQLA